jgi:ribonuclease-3
MERVRKFTEPLFGPALDDILNRTGDKDAKSLLQEWSQAAMGHTPIYRTVSSEGPDHAKLFTVQVVIGTTVAGVGTGYSKQTAAQSAAQKALEAIDTGDVVFDEA